MGVQGVGIRLFTAVLLVALLLPALPAAAGEGERRERKGPEELMKILKGLELGMMSLKSLGRHEELKMLQRVANDVREKIATTKHGRRPGPEDQEAGRDRLKVMRYAVDAFLEAGKEEAADVMERTMHALELTLKGRKDDEAMRVRERAPGVEDQVELLGWAANLYKEWGSMERSEACARLAKQMAHRGKDRPRAKEPDREAKQRERHHSERDLAVREIEVLQFGRKAMLEAERGELAELFERAVRAREVVLEGRRDREAAEIRERDPGPGQLAEMLTYAGKLYAEWGHEERARACNTLGEGFANQARHRRERPRGGEHREAGERPHREERPEHLEGNVEELRRQFRALQEQMEQLQRVLNKLREESR